jgi:hypothetical protein
MSKHFAQSDRLTLSSHKNSILLGIILNSFIHTADAERNIKRKDLASCYKKYTVHRYSGNNGITKWDVGEFFSNTMNQQLICHLNNNANSFQNQE